MQEQTSAIVHLNGGKNIETPRQFFVIASESLQNNFNVIETDYLSIISYKKEARCAGQKKTFNSIELRGGLATRDKYQRENER